MERKGDQPKLAEATILKKKKKRTSGMGREEWECMKKKERGGREAGSAGHKPNAFR